MQNITAISDKQTLSHRPHWISGKQHNGINQPFRSKLLFARYLADLLCSAPGSSRFHLMFSCERVFFTRDIQYNEHPASLLWFIFHTCSSKAGFVRTAPYHVSLILRGVAAAPSALRFLCFHRLCAMHHLQGWGVTDYMKWIRSNYKKFGNWNFLVKEHSNQRKNRWLHVRLFQNMFKRRHFDCDIKDTNTILHNMKYFLLMVVNYHKNHSNYILYIKINSR